MGLEKLGVEKNEVVMIVTPNHIYVPIAYLGTVGSGRIFSGANPAYTADGRLLYILVISKQWLWLDTQFHASSFLEFVQTHLLASPVSPKFRMSFHDIE